MLTRNLFWITRMVTSIVIGMLISCSTAQGGSVKDHTTFVSALRARGLAVDTVGPIDQPFLQTEGVALRVSGSNVPAPTELQSFNYDDQDLGTDGLKAANEDASQIEPNGNPKTMRIDWIAPPHFFRKERVIVIYIGSDANMLTILKEILGPQFAGK